MREPAQFLGLLHCCALCKNGKFVGRDGGFRVVPAEYTHQAEPTVYRGELHAVGRAGHGDENPPNGLPYLYLQPVGHTRKLPAAGCWMMRRLGIPLNAITRPSALSMPCLAYRL